MSEIPEASGSFASRKFLLTLLGLLLIVCVTVVGMFAPTVPAIMPAFISGVLGVLSLYFAGNITNKYVVGKTLQNNQEDDNAGDG